MTYSYPQHPVFETGAPPVVATGLYVCLHAQQTILHYRTLFRLAMNRMMPASRTKLLRLQAFGIFPLVLGRGVISFLAVRTLQSNDISHKNSKGPQKSRKVSKTLLVNFVPFCGESL